jgi:tRNA threonylcarbamoyladenosine biosynthesis protein TsaB
MRVLALDTTTRSGSVALVDEERIVEEQAGDATRTHAERLPRELLDLLDAAGATLASIDLFAVAAGPGSFTGLRIGIAAMQGLAVVTGRRIVAVSALEALAHAASEGRAAGTLVAAWIDAHRQDVFSAVYRVTDAPPFHPGRLIEVDAPRVDRPETIVGAWRIGGRLPAAVAGDGAVRYEAALGALLPAATPTVLDPPRLAGIIGRMAVMRARAGGAIHPAAVRPLYIRRPDAVLARELRHHG